MSKVPFFVILSVALWQIFQLPELPEHGSAKVTNVMPLTHLSAAGRVWRDCHLAVRHPVRPRPRRQHRGRRRRGRPPQTASGQLPSELQLEFLLRAGMREGIS